MPRQPRQRSESGYLHLIVRGIGRQALFEEREDYQFFLSILERFSRETGVIVCAYCLMENHVHLLVRDNEERVALLMKKLGVSYSQYFNRKYDRHGHLFQDRYMSEPVNDERYLLTVFRYILNNSQKAGICTAAEYEWSSYRMYGRDGGLVDTTVLHALIGGDERYAEFIAAANEDQCLVRFARPLVGQRRHRLPRQRTEAGQAGSLQGHPDHRIAGNMKATDALNGDTWEGPRQFA